MVLLGKVPQPADAADALIAAAERTAPRMLAGAYTRPLFGST